MQIIFLAHSFKKLQSGVGHNFTSFADHSFTFLRKDHVLFHSKLYSKNTSHVCQIFEEDNFWCLIYFTLLFFCVLFFLIRHQKPVQEENQNTYLPISLRPAGAQTHHSLAGAQRRIRIVFVSLVLFFFIEHKHITRLTCTW